MAPRGPQEAPKSSPTGPKRPSRGTQDAQESLRPRASLLPFSRQFPWASVMDGLVGIREASTITYSMQISFPDAKFARPHAPGVSSGRKICTCTRPMHHVQTQNLHAHACYPPSTHAKFARTRELNSTTHRAICTTKFVTAFARCLFHVRAPNLHVPVTNAACRDAKFARSHAPCLMSKRRICTCTQAIIHFHTQNLHGHVS